MKLRSECELLSLLLTAFIRGSNSAFDRLSETVISCLQNESEEKSNRKYLKKMGNRRELTCSFPSPPFDSRPKARYAHVEGQTRNEQSPINELRPNTVRLTNRVYTQPTG